MRGRRTGKSDKPSGKRRHFRAVPQQPGCQTSPGGAALTAATARDFTGRKPLFTPAFRAFGRVRCILQRARHRLLSRGKGGGQARSAAAAGRRRVRPLRSDATADGACAAVVRSHPRRTAARALPRRGCAGNEENDIPSPQNTGNKHGLTFPKVSNGKCYSLFKIYRLIFDSSLRILTMCYAVTLWDKRQFPAAF